MYRTMPYLRLLNDPRCWLALMATGWSILLIPEDALVRPAYHMMRNLLPERAWLVLYSLYSLGAWICIGRRTRGWRLIVVSGFGLVLFTISCSSFVAANLQPTPVFVATAVVLVLMALWIFISSWVDE